ncbi:hypothetical protein MAN88_47100 [Microcystis aeruginosa]|nr:hypothetical protein MAN88_47100 [Microcystis aeruginosa]
MTLTEKQKNLLRWIVKEGASQFCQNINTIQ